MAKLNMLFLILVLSLLSQCSTLDTNQQYSNATNQDSTPAIDYKKLIAGSWKCEESEIYVSFNDGTMTVDYSTPRRKERKFPYKFKNESTLEVSNYPDNLVIEKYTDDAIGFRPDGHEPKESIDMLYLCRFVRFKK